MLAVHLPEECLKVLGQFSPPSIARVHGDENSHGRGHPDLSIEEHETLLLGANGILEERRTLRCFVPVCYSLLIHSYYRPG